MKSAPLLRIVLALSLIPPAGILAQDYAITWHSIDAGAGRSSGGDYSLNGSVGQPDVGVFSGGDFALVGGFWSFVSAVPTLGAPALKILVRTDKSVVVLWPSVAGNGFVLQQTGNLAVPQWSTAPQKVNDDGTTRWVDLPPAGGCLFLRLAK